jgi:hypothetical protein
VLDVAVDGVSVGAASWDDVFTLIGAYLFAPSGGALVPSSTITWQFGNNPHQDKQFTRMGFDGTVTSITPHNVTSYNIYINNVVTNSPFVFVKGDEVFIEIIRTNPSQSAHLEWMTDGINAPLTYQSQHYFIPRTFKFRENINIIGDYTNGIGIQGNGSTASFLTNIIFEDYVQGNFQVVFEPAHYNFTGQLTFGLNNQGTTNTPVNRYPRMIHCIMLDANAVKIYELGVLLATITLPYNQMMHFRIYSKLNIISGVYENTYWYSNNNMSSWSLLYTSLVNHSGTKKFYPDWATQGGYYAKFHAPLLQQL